MGYRALLFCPDEKTAQTVTLLLNDLEFSVEACSEPFVAVKKLMGEHFDGVVVDCDNEQNATLLFKSARQSASNQAALAVAVVEGQAGVAKAFRIGANLVLTKPINVEQAKGTLRVARGLLRKGESVKPLAHPESATIAAPRATTPSRSANNLASSTSSQAASSIMASSKRTPVSPAKASPWGNPFSDSLVPATNSSAHDQAASPEPISAKLPIGVESIPPTTTAPSITAPGPSAAFSAMQQIARKVPESGSSNHGSSGHVSLTSATGSASATAPARVPQGTGPTKTVEPLLSKIARTIGTMDELGTTSDPETSVATAARTVASIPLEASDSQLIAENYLRPKVETKSEPMPETKSQPRPDMAGGKKVLLAVVAIVLLAVALYFFWNQRQTRINLSSATASQVAGTNSPQPAAKSTQATPLPSPTAPPSSASSAGQTMQRAEQPGSKAASDANETAPETNDDSATGNSNKPSTRDSSSTAKSSVQPLIVKSGNKTSAAKRTTTDTSAPDVVVSAQDSASALPNLIDVSTKSAPVLQTLTISQGVSQGLILKKVQPNYPSAALRLQLEGSVRLVATVGKKGNITSVKTLSGEPLLAQAAADALKQWKYKPYLLNGEPVEIQTQVTINFRLPH